MNLNDHAFLLLDELQPEEADMVTCAEHDCVWLAIDCRKLAKVITPEQVIELLRSGVSYDQDNGSLRVFV